MKRLIATAALALALTHCSNAGFNSTQSKASPAPAKKDVTSKDTLSKDLPVKDSGPKSPTPSANGAKADTPIVVNIGEKVSLCDKAGVAKAGDGSKSEDDSKATFDAQSCAIAGVGAGPVKIMVNTPGGTPKAVYVNVVDPNAPGTTGGSTGGSTAGTTGGTAGGDDGTEPAKTDTPVAVESFASDLVCSDRKYRIGNACVDAIPIYRWYNGSAGDHFYSPSAGPGCQGKSSSAPECGGEVVNEGGWHYEGVGFYSLPLDQPPVPQLAKFYRMWKGATNDHFYTASEDEKNGAVAGGYVLEGFYQVFPSQQPFTKPIHRWYNGQDHFYTFAAGPDCAGKSSGAAECGGETVNEGSYHYEGVAGYLFPN